MEEDQIGSPYFPQISPKMFDIKFNTYNAEFRLAEKDMGFVKLFLELCLERWDMNSDEQSRDILRCILTCFQVIWIQDQDHNGRTIQDRITTPPKEGEVQDIRGRIHLTKILMEGWCLTLLPNSLIQCKPTSFHEVQEFLRQVNHNLSGLLRLVRCAGIVPLEYFGIIIKMTDFMIHLFDYINDSTESIDLLNFVKFASAFTNKATCFTCLCWAKEAITDDEMNILLFAMIHQFIPSAPHVIASCFRILPSKTLLSVFVQEETLQGFVDFFFGCLKITHEDRFLILKDQLKYLFTFISNHPRESKEEEEVLIIYALFREDAYPLLSFNDMKEDLSNNNIILTKFITNIQTTNDKLIQHSNILSYSWIGSEAVKMDYFFLSVKRMLINHIDQDINEPEYSIFHQPEMNQILLFVMELGFLMESLLWFAMLDEEIKTRLNLVIYSLQGIWGKEEEQKGLLADRLYKKLKHLLDDDKGMADWHVLAFELQGKIELSKLEISTQLLNEFDWSLQSKPSTSHKVLKLLDSILHNLNALVRYKASMILPFIKQIETLQDKLAFMQNIMKLVGNCTHSKEDFSEFILFVHDFVKEAARLSILYWLKEANDKTAAEISLILLHTLHKIKPTTPCVARLYFDTLKALYLHRSDLFLFGHSASFFVDFLFEDSVTDFKDDFQILQEDVIFLLTFLNDPASGSAEELFDNTFWENVYGILPIDDMKGDFSHHLSGFMMKIKEANAKIRKLHCEFPDSLLYDLPKIMSPWYLDFLIQKLRNLKERMITDRKFVPFVKYKTIIFEQELVSMSPVFNYIFKLQNELFDAWLQVVDVVHLTEHVINSCIRSWFVYDHPIWYYMAYLSDVLDRIKAIKTKLEKIKENNMHNVCYLPHSACVTGTSLKQEWSSEIDEVVVGFDDMARKLIDDLIGEHKPLDIVSIVGMGGLGKTTLARKVSSSVKDHFHTLAFYTVSQDHNIRMLLLGILKNMMTVDDEISRMDDDDLAHKLKKCLSRRKYLIVLDDIWSTDVWTKVRKSFPDDKNGSRVMFTTRLKDVANECKMKCSPFEMPFISDVESWELLQKKVFQNGISPPHLSNIRRHIAESCKGLPLAIVVIAGILATKENNEGSWSEIAEKVYSLLSEDEGCMNILELSYDHLPEYLKPCILYLGAFPEDYLFRVKRVIQLWIAEGFIPEYETKSVEDVGKEYFEDLVGRSLIIVSSRGSNGEINTFKVHDLIHKLCQTKCQEGNFFNIGRGISASTSMYDLSYRISISDADVPVIISGGSSSLENASTLLLMIPDDDDDVPRNISGYSCFKKLKLVQVLYLENNRRNHSSDLTFLTSMVNLRHIEYHFNYHDTWLPASISNLWNIQSLILTGSLITHSYVPKVLWKMKSLRHVKICSFGLQFSDEKLDKVISFSSPILYSGKELEQLLERLPVVRKLGIHLMSLPYNEDRWDNVDTLDFFRKLELLNVRTIVHVYSDIRPYLINFPSTLKKLTLQGLDLPFTKMSSIAELKCLRVLKLRWNSFKGKTTLEMEDVVFSYLVFFELYDQDLVQWNASTESFPCLEQLLIGCPKLEELPSCFGEVSTLKRIAIFYPSTGFDESVGRIGEELTDLGNKVQVTID